MRPPIRSTMRWQIARPRPVPPYRRVVDASACVNAWNRRDCASAAMPMPVSRTSKRSWCCAVVSPTRRTLIEIEPRSVNFTALLIRLVSTWRRRTGSPRTGRRTPGSRCRCRRRPLDSAGRSISCMTASSRSRRLNVGGFQFELVRFELGVVEDVVDDAQQLLRRGVGGAHEFVLVGQQARVQQQVEHRHDAVERRADFVAHRGEEFALGQHRRFGRLLGLRQLLFEFVVALDFALQLVDFELPLLRLLLHRRHLLVAAMQDVHHRHQRDQRRQHEAGSRRICHGPSMPPASSASETAAPAAAPSASHRIVSQRLVAWRSGIRAPRS